MKRTILTLGLIAFLGLSAASCSADDSDMQTTQADDVQTGNIGTIDNGDRELPKPPMRP
ncbi:hypothetical protein [Flavobacterium sp. MK4S-17]|jgi:hypothetical protein|uniref:hypothetical protein n=1 Tax=Flavobacterium sp. MK4S-17 TaxID=2543737 RepID=UPI00135BDCC1|nr:hypothetical protein [Flavobacterium sp. MK4S-17]